MYGWVPMLYSRNGHNIVNQLKTKKLERVHLWRIKPKRLHLDQGHHGMRGKGVGLNMEDKVKILKLEDLYTLPDSLLQISQNWSSRCGAAEMNLTRTMRLQVRSLASLSGLRMQHCGELWCRSQTWLGSGVAVAVAQAGSYSSDLTPHLGTSICCGSSPKKHTPPKKKSPELSHVQKTKHICWFTTESQKLEPVMLFVKAAPTWTSLG